MVLNSFAFFFNILYLPVSDESVFLESLQAAKGEQNKSVVKSFFVANLTEDTDKVVAEESCDTGERRISGGFTSGIDSISHNLCNERKRVHAA